MDHGPVSSQPSARRYALGSVPNMVRSLVVVLGIVLALIVMVPRTTSVPTPTIDVVAVAASAAASAGWAVSAPTALPAGWVATSARYDTTNLPAPTWFVGYQTPEGTYAALSQARTSDPEWLAAVTGRGARTGERSIGGRTWAEYALLDGTQNSLVAGWPGAGSGEGVVTVVSGTAAFSDLVTLAEHLRPVTTPTSSGS